MSEIARQRVKGRRIAPFTWLGAGAVTLGLGVALVGGTAVAVADTGADSAATTTSDGAAGPGPSAAAGTGRKKPVRAARANTSPAPAASGDSSATRKNRVSLPVPAASVDQTVATTPAVIDPVVASGANETVQHSAPIARRTARKPVARVALPSSTPSTDPTGPVGSAAANAVANVVADPPTPSAESWLPGGNNDPSGTQIVPGAHVALTFNEIAAAQGLITQATFGSGNVVAGLAGLVPQVFLASAALSLQLWETTNPAAQQFVASVAGIPILAQIAQVNLLLTMTLPTVAEVSMAGAALFLPVVGIFGADITAAAQQVSLARQDGKIYAVVPVRMKATTQPTIDISVNGHPRASVLIDTGASGLIMSPNAVDLTGLTPVGPIQESSFSGGLTYNYQTYEGAVVDFGGGAVSTPTSVNVVVDTPDNPNSVADFEDFLSWGAAGILGVGANRYAGPGPAPIPTTALPGELSDGFLLYQNALPFGIGGFMVFGPSPLPTRVSVPGSPDVFLQMRVGSGNLTPVNGIIDSGGVTGTVPANLTLLPVGSQLPAGTPISVYTADGNTLLYSYTTTSSNSPYVVAAGPDAEANTGHNPFNLNPIYINYGYDGPTGSDYGIGSTDFVIW